VHLLSGVGPATRAYRSATRGEAAGNERAYRGPVTIWTIGHGTRPLDELLSMVVDAGVRTLIDVRRYPGSRRNPQFNQPELRTAIEGAGVAYRHAVDLGGRLSNEPGEDDFECIRVAAFRSYAARMRTADWQRALAGALEEPDACFLCSETPWWRCHRRLIAELLCARGEEVVHLMAPGRTAAHQPWSIAEVREGRLFLCGRLVA
jgi:uncharacterized protein (DUF488 family)